MSIIYHKESLFERDLEYQDDPMTHCVSQDLKMGAGIALVFRQRYGVPSKSADIGKFVIHAGNYHLVTKSKYFNKPTMQSLTNCLNNMKKHALENNVERIHMPCIGCGLDRLNWAMVEAALEEIFGDTEIELHVYLNI